MSYDGIEFTIKTTTLSTVGIEVSRHLFRTSAASTAATLAGANPYLGAALLHHTDSTSTNEHYNRASSQTAVGKLREVLQRYTKISQG